MITIYDKRAHKLTTYEVPANGMLRSLPPARCPAPCCDIACGCGQDDPDCRHTAHEIGGNCLVAITLGDDNEPHYECLTQIPRGASYLDCLHATAAECDCEIRAEYEAKIAAKLGPARTVGSRQAAVHDADVALLTDVVGRRPRPE